MNRRILFAVLLAVLGLVGSGIFPSYAMAQPTAIAQSTATVQSTAVAHFTAISKAPTFDVSITSVGKPTLREGDKLHVEARLANKTDAQLTLKAELSATATFATRSHLLTFIGQSASAKEGSKDLVPVTQKPQSVLVPAHSQRTVVFEADTADLGWSAEKWGPRGVEVDATSPHGDKAADRSLVVVEPPTSIKAVPTGVVIPLTNSRTELSSLYTADDLTHIRSKPTARIKNLAEVMKMKGVSVIADPAYADLSRAPQTLVSAKADANITALLDLKRDDLAQSLTEETFKGGKSPVRVNFPGSLDAFAQYEELGASAFILDSSQCRTAHNNYGTPATHMLLEGENTRFEVLLSDNESAQAIVQARNPLQARQNALALSSMTYLEQPSITRPQLLYIDLADDTIWKTDAQGKVVRDYSQLAEATSALMNAPWVQPAQVSDLLNTPASSSVHLLKENKGTRSSPLTEKTLDSIETSISNASTPARLVDNPATVLAPVEEASAYLYSQNWNSNKKLYNNALTDFSFLADEYGASVSVTSLSTVNLVAQQVDIPVRVQNTLHVPATVTVELDSVDARLSGEKSVVVELPPASTTTVSIPVSARGSGNVKATIHLYDSQGNSVGNPTTVKVRVRAEWENTATIVLGIIFALMLVLGIVRSVRRGRRSGPVTPRDYTQARRNRDLAFAGHTDETHLS